MKPVLADFGNRQVEITVPKHAVVIEFEDKSLLADPVTGTNEAISAPHGSPPLSELSGPGKRIAIGFDDPTRPSATVQTIILGAPPRAPTLRSRKSESCSSSYYFIYGISLCGNCWLGIIKSSFRHTKNTGMYCNICWGHYSAISTNNN